MNPSKKRDDPQMPMPRQLSNRQLEEPVYYANDAKQLDRNIHDMETQIQQKQQLLRQELDQMRQQ